jgi:hypothetical protein
MLMTEVSLSWMFSHYCSIMHCYMAVQPPSSYQLPHLLCRSAWVGAQGNNTLHNPAAPNTSGPAAQPGAATQGWQQQPTPAAARQNMPQPETTLRWLGGERVDAALLRRLVALPSVWSAHDVIWSIQARLVRRELHDGEPLVIL